MTHQQAAPRRERYQLPSVSAPSLDDLRVEIAAPVPPTAEELVEALHQRLRAHAPRREREAGEAIEVGDEVECDIVTVVAGEVVPGSVKQGARLEMREFLHLPGFIEQLLTMKTFTARTFELTLPDDYPLPNLAGQRATFYVEARRVFQVDTPELDDLASLEAAGLGQSIDEAMETVAAEIDAEQGDELLTDATQLVLEALAQRVEAEVPPAAIDEELRQTWQNTEGALLQQKPFSAEMLEQAQSDFLLNPELRAEAEHRIKVGLALGAIIEQEQLAPSEETMEMLVETAAEVAGTTVDEVKATLSSGPFEAQQAAHTALYHTAVEFVMERAVVEVLESS